MPQYKAAKRDFKLYKTLFMATFSVSAFTFGGGYVIVPLMKQKFVHTLGWIEEGEMLDIVAISQSLPGPMAIDAGRHCRLPRCRHPRRNRIASCNDFTAVGHSFRNFTFLPGISSESGR